MLDTGIRLFETARQFRQLGRVECLHLMPQNEMAVLKLVADSALQDQRGLSVSEMAQRLNVSVPLVSRTLKGLLEKLYHAMRTEALLWTQEEKNGTLNLNGQGCQEK